MTMTPKEKINRLVAKIPDDATLDEVFYRLKLFHAVEVGLRDIEEGRVIDHDTLFDQLLSEDEEGKTPMVGARPSKSSRNKIADRQRQAKNGPGLHKTAKRTRK